jgi:hypothetical protein
MRSSPPDLKITIQPPARDGAIIDYLNLTGYLDLLSIAWLSSTPLDISGPHSW